MVARGEGGRDGRAAILGRRDRTRGAVRGGVRAEDHRAGPGVLRLRRRGCGDPGLHLGSDECGAGTRAPRRGGHGVGGDRHARPHLQRHADAPGGRGVADARRDLARRAVQGVAAHHGRGVQRGGHQDGQALHRQVRDRLVRPVLARHDVGCGVGDVQRGSPRPRSAHAGQPGAAHAERLPLAVPPSRRQSRLGGRTGVRLRRRRRAVVRQPGGVPRRAHPVLGRHRSSCPSDTCAGCASCAPNAACC